MKVEKPNALGFTLLEVVVSILIISVLTATFAPLIVSSIERIRWAGERLVELYAARSQIETAMAKKGLGMNGLKTQDLWIGNNATGYARKIRVTVIAIDDFVSLIPAD